VYGSAGGVNAHARAGCKTIIDMTEVSVSRLENTWLWKAEAYVHERNAQLSTKK
jgi:hypothetical protein